VTIAGTSALAAEAPPHLPRRAASLVGGRVPGFLLVAALLCLWELSARLGWVRSDNWPPFSRVLAEAGRGLGADLGPALWGTFYRMGASLLVGSLLGVAAGLLLGRYRWLDWAVRPLIEIQRTLPAPALVPPLILVLGLGDALKVTVVSLAVFAPVFVSTYAGVKGLDPTLALTARTFGLGPWATLWKIVLPNTVPSIAAGIRTSLALALVVTVVSEMVTGVGGMGQYILTMEFAMRADTLYGAVIVLSGIGYAINRCFLMAERRVLHWHFRG
jgi:ABC-type nitrate/sulfonate/bicarbonate transport system permease component